MAIGDLKGWDCPVAVDASAYGDKPFWYRMIHKGDRIGLYEGPDGQKWMASNAGALIAGTIYAGLYTEGWDEQTMAQYDNVTIDKHVPLPQPCTAAECSRFSRWRPPNVCQEAADTSRRSGQSVHQCGIPRRPQCPRQGRQVRCSPGAVPAMVRF